MALKDLALWKRKDNRVKKSESMPVLRSFPQEMDRLIDSFFSDFGSFSSSLFGRDRFESFSPRIDISEDESSMTVSAELPGLEEKDIQLSMQDNILTIKGEKKSEEERKEKEYYRIERSFGSFQRSIRLPEGIDLDIVNASFKNGVLNVSLPKSETAKKSVRKIEVKAA